ncbi:unnamed protein product [Peniophora sp. CBMAI 1063]|nr:unnamed protein product [Peniophora sp. CBMAI 1063]
MPTVTLLLQLVKLSVEIVAVLALSSLSLHIARGALSRRTKYRVLRSIPGPPHTSFMTGNLKKLYDPSGALYGSLRQYGGVVKIHGLFGDVSLAVSDPRALTQILIQDIANYPAIDWSAILGLLGPGLLAHNGPPHRQQRKLLNPSFSPTNIRKLTPLVHEISRELRDAIAKDVLSGGAREREIDIAEWFSRAGLEMIARAGLGHSFHAFQGEGDAYAQAVKAIAPTFMELGTMVPFFVMNGAGGLPPSLLRFLGSSAALVSPAYRRMVDVIHTLRRESHAIWEARKKARKDGLDDGQQLLSVLLDASGEDRVPDELLSGHATTTLVAGTDTTSTALSRILHLLTLQPNVQDKLRQEIVRAQSASIGEGNIDGLAYDALMKLPFLDAVCRETLRLFAPLPFRNRRSLRSHIVTLTDGTSVHIPAHTEILVNIHSLNTDESIWGPDAHEWKPERWLKPLPQSVSQTKIPGVWGGAMTFGAGPKGCIGFTFSVLEMKSILATILPAFRFSLPQERKLEWRFGPIVVPGVRGEMSVNPRMPLAVEVLQVDSVPSGAF